MVANDSPALFARSTTCGSTSENHDPSTEERVITLEIDFHSAVRADFWIHPHLPLKRTNRRHSIGNAVVSRAPQFSRSYAVDDEKKFGTVCESVI